VKLRPVRRVRPVRKLQLVRRVRRILRKKHPRPKSARGNRKIDGGRVRGGNVEGKEWTVKELLEALKRFPLEAKVYYEMGPNGLGTIGKAQFVRARGASDDMGVLLDR
jgi:hypothetical protein